MIDSSSSSSTSASSKPSSVVCDSLANGGSTTPIRPRPILASQSYSFDSGYEVSPICLGTFRYEDSVTEQMNTMSIEEQLSDHYDSIEGFDEELISIGHHFTPISSPTGATDLIINLAELRRQNQLDRQHEINNNDVNFPDLSLVDRTHNSGVFLMDDDVDEDDDDVFFDSDDEDLKDYTPDQTCVGSRSESCTSVRSSTPIPIPKATPRFSEGNSLEQFSVPNGCRMPFYHRFAARMALPNILADVPRNTFRRNVRSEDLHNYHESDMTNNQRSAPSNGAPSFQESHSKNKSNVATSHQHGSHGMSTFTNLVS